LKSVSPALSSEIGRPAIEPELSRSRRQGQRGSGLSANSAAAKFDSLEYGTWSNDDIVSPRRKRNDNFWLFLMRRQGHQVTCARNVSHGRNRVRRHRHTRRRAKARIGGSSFHCANTRGNSLQHRQGIWRALRIVDAIGREFVIFEARSLRAFEQLKLVPHSRRL